MKPKCGRSKVTISERYEEYKNEGLYISSLSAKQMMCKYCNILVNWQKKSILQAHCNEATGHTKRKKAFLLSESLKQASIKESFKKSSEIKDNKDNLNMSTVEACFKANIPLHKLDNPSFRNWINKNVNHGGNIASAKWLRENYVPKIKSKYDESTKNVLKNKQIVVMCDETTNRKGEAVFLVIFKILPSQENLESLMIIAAAEVLEICSGDACCKSVIKALNKFDVAYENVVAVSSDSARYMNLCVRLLKELVNPLLEHIQCWDHKLDKVSKMFSTKLTRLNECVKKTKKFFKNTRKRRNVYMKFLKDRYHFIKKKSPRLFPLPVMSRWGSWRKSVVYLHEYLEDVTDYAKTLKEDVVSVNYFKNLTKEDLDIIKTEASFVKDYSLPIDNLLLLLEGSKYPTAHRLYPQVKELIKFFSVLHEVEDPKSVLMEGTKSCLAKVESRTKRKNLESRIKNLANSCQTLLKDFITNDLGINLFKSCEALFSPSAIISLKSKSMSESSTIVKKYKEKLYLLTKIPTPEFLVLYLLMADQVCDAVKTNAVIKGQDYCVVKDVLLNMRAKHPDFAISCLQVISLPTSNTDVERSFSSYNDIVSARRTRLLEGSAEIMLCLYESDDINVNMYNKCTDENMEYPF